MLADYTVGKDRDALSDAVGCKVGLENPGAVLLVVSHLMLGHELLDDVRRFLEDFRRVGEAVKGNTYLGEGHTAGAIAYVMSKLIQS